MLPSNLDVSRFCFVFKVNGKEQDLYAILFKGQNGNAQASMTGSCTTPSSRLVSSHILLFAIPVLLWKWNGIVRHTSISMNCFLFQETAGYLVPRKRWKISKLKNI